MRAPLRETIRRIIADESCADIGHVTDAADLYADLGLDSLDRVTLVMELEREFALDIDDGVAARWETVADVYQYFES